MNKYKLEDLCEIKSGGTPRRSRNEFFDGDILWAKIGDISKADGVIYETEEKITEEGLENINNRMFKKGTLLFSMYGSIGKVAIAGKDMSTNQAILGINIKDPSKLDQQYLNHWFTYQKKKLENETRGVTLKNLSATKVKNLDISLPPLENQKKIAAVLDKADALRQKRRQTIEKLDALTRSVFLDMFGDPKINPKGYNELPIKKIGKVVTGNTPPKKNPKNYGEEIEWIKTSNIEAGLINLTRAEEYLSKEGKQKGRVVPRGSILVCCIAGSLSSIGKAAIANREIAFNQQINAIIPDEKMDSYFLYTQLKLSQKLIQESSTKSMKGMINKTKFQNISLPVPDIELQRKFSIRFKKAYQLKSVLKKQLNKLDNLFNSLLQQAFKGELNFSDSEEPLLTAEEAGEYSAG